MEKPDLRPVVTSCCLQIDFDTSGWQFNGDNMLIRHNFEFNWVDLTDLIEQIYYL